MNRLLINEITSLDQVYSANHTPYGELWNGQGSSPMPFGFTGEWQDPNELLFLRARYYNPSQAAFLSLDPLEGGLGDVKALNRYGYVTANPANLVDPSGLLFEDPNVYSGCEATPGRQNSSNTCDTNGRGGVRIFSGTDTINPNRIDTTLLGTWGVVLTVQCDPALSGVYWTPTHRDNVRRVFSLIDARLRAVAGSDFRSVFGGLELRHVGSLSTGAGARTVAPNPYFVKISSVGRGGLSRATQGAFGIGTPTGPYGLNVANEQGIQATVTHELGHILDYRTDLDMSSDATALQLRPVNTPSGNPVGQKWENTSSDIVEVVADHFLNWAQYSYRADTDPIDPDTYPGDDESIQVVKTIPAYWMGNITVPVSNVDLGPSSGIANWASVATKYSQILQSLELYLKLGMFDEVGINAPV